MKMKPDGEQLFFSKDEQFAIFKYWKRTKLHSTFEVMVLSKDSDKKGQMLRGRPYIPIKKCKSLKGALKYIDQYIFETKIETKAW